MTSRFERALVYAARLHAKQQRKVGDAPYLAHLLGVASLVLEDGGDEDEAIAALLHDSIEDQGVSRGEIANLFGKQVANIVSECTDTDRRPKPPWRQRKEAYVAHVGDAPASVRRVSMADKLYNVRATMADLRAEGEAVWSKFNGGKTGTLWYFRALVAAFRKSGSGRLLGELDRAVSELEALAAAVG